MIKETDGNILTCEKSVLRIWKEYFKEQMNLEYERKRTVKWMETVKQKVRKISEDEEKL